VCAFVINSRHTCSYDENFQYSIVPALKSLRLSLFRELSLRTGAYSGAVDITAFSYFGVEFI
jgi:hypothetical protein